MTKVLYIWIFVTAALNLFRSREVEFMSVISNLFSIHCTFHRLILASRMQLSNNNKNNKQQNPISNLKKHVSFELHFFWKIITLCSKQTIIDNTLRNPMTRVTPIVIMPWNGRQVDYFVTKQHRNVNKKHCCKLHIVDSTGFSKIL